MTKTGWSIAAVVAIALIGGFLLLSSSAKAPTMDQGATSSATGTDLTQSTNGADAMDDIDAGSSTGGVRMDVSGSVSSAPMSASVVYNGISFSPANVTIGKGGTVTFTDSDGAMWVASDVHPLHASYDGTDRASHCAAGYSGAKPFDQCSRGSSYSFTFNKAGTYGYHDHLNASAQGTIVVK